MLAVYDCGPFEAAMAGTVNGTYRCDGPNTKYGGDACYVSCDNEYFPNERKFVCSPLGKWTVVAAPGVPKATATDLCRK